MKGIINREIGKGEARTNRFSVSPKKVAILLTVAVGALVLGSFIANLHRQQNDTAEKKEGVVTSDEALDDRTKIPETAMERSVAKTYENDYEGAQLILDEEIAKTSDAELVHDLSLQQAANAYNDGKYKEGLVFARQAIEHSDSLQANKIAGRAAAKDGQFQVAVTYYEAALKRIPDDDKSVAANREKRQIEKFLEDIKND